MRLPFLIFAAFMAIVYVGLGAVLAFSLFGLAERPFLQAPYQQWFGAGLMAYGVFRFYRAWVTRNDGNGPLRERQPRRFGSV